MLIQSLIALSCLQGASITAGGARAIADLRTLEFEWSSLLGGLSAQEEKELLRQASPYCILERARLRGRLAKHDKRHICPMCSNDKVVIITPGEIKHLQRVLPELMRKLQGQQSHDCKTCGGSAPERK